MKHKKTLKFNLTIQFSEENINLIISHETCGAIYFYQNEEKNIYVCCDSDSNRALREAAAQCKITFVIIEDENKITLNHPKTNSKRPGDHFLCDYGHITRMQAVQAVEGSGGGVNVQQGSCL